MSEAETAGSGWYPQPDGTLRYWDGIGWTEHIATDRLELGRRARERNRKMVSALATVRKYGLAISGDRWANASFIGTESWEDYAGQATRMMQLETSTNSDERLERIEALLAEILTEMKSGRS